jgi:pimeloyl-ACP methyl ester carboxylesterase
VFRGLLGGGQIVRDLTLANDDPEADDIGDGVQATRLVNDVHLFPGLWSIDGYTKVARRLRMLLRLQPEANYFEFPYDWRRDNRVAARKLPRQCAVWLARRRKDYPDAKIILIAHSMGGLISRHFLEVMGGWRDTRALITFGTPYRGSVNALETLVNGVRKLGLLDLTDLSRSFTSTYQLLPIFPCLGNGDGALVRLSEAAYIPRLNQAQRDRVVAAERFHRDIEKAAESNQASVGAGVTRYAIRPIVGIDQPTSQTAITAGDGIELLRSRLGADEGGDGTVPRVSASPIEAGEAQAMFVAARHGSLQNADAVLAHVHGVLTAPRDLDRVRAVGAPVTLSLDIDGIFASGEPLQFAVRPSVAAVPMEVVVESIDGSAPQKAVSLAPSDEPWVRVQVSPLPAGVYRITVRGEPTQVEPVTEIFGVA